MDNLTYYQIKGFNENGRVVFDETEANLNGARDTYAYALGKYQDAAVFFVARMEIFSYDERELLERGSHWCRDGKVIEKEQGKPCSFFFGEN